MSGLPSDAAAPPIVAESLFGDLSMRTFSDLPPRPRYNRSSRRDLNVSGILSSSSSSDSEPLSSSRSYGLGRNTSSGALIGFVRVDLMYVL